MTRMIIAAAVLILAPLAASAECPREHQASMSCPTGQVWDGETKACILQSS